MQTSRNHVGNIYGLDIKITEVNGHVIPIGIEMNGVDFGTNFFGYEKGFNYYGNFARVIGAAAQGRPIFIEEHGYEHRDPVANARARAKIEEEKQATKVYIEKIRYFLGEVFDFDSSWIDDLYNFELSRLESTVSDAEDSFYAFAAKQERVPFFVFRDIKYSRDGLEFILNDGGSLRIRPEEVGAIRDSSSYLGSVPPKYQHLFLSSALVETVLDSKPFFNFLGNYNPNLRNLFASAIPYGAGVNHALDVLKFFAEADADDMIVRKRGDSYCGTGVEILRAANLLKSLEQASSSYISPAKQQAMIVMIVYSLRKIHYEKYVSMYERFISSIPIFDSRTGKYHDGCARTVVYSRSGHAPIVLGSQWRLAPRSIDDSAAPMEERFRANLSRGAREMPIAPEHEIAINNFAVLAVKEFEQALYKWGHAHQEDELNLEETWPGATLSEKFRATFWASNFLNWLRNANVEISHLKQEIVLLPGFEENFDDIFKRMEESANKKIIK